MLANHNSVIVFEVRNLANGFKVSRGKRLCGVMADVVKSDSAQRRGRVLDIIDRDSSRGNQSRGREMQAYQIIRLACSVG